MGRYKVLNQEAANSTRIGLLFYFIYEMKTGFVIEPPRYVFQTLLNLRTAS
jgi:hypothetical protein